MIQATARILQNQIEIVVGSDTWVARPVVHSTGAISRRLAALFSTVYEIRRPSEPEEVHSTVSYHPKRDEIIVQIGEKKWLTQSTLFGPTTFEYGGVTYLIVEKLTGRFGILRGSELIGQGELGFRSCQLKEYPPELEVFLANLCLGYLIRSLFWAQ
jgi:hypothetical protein